MPADLFIIPFYPENSTFRGSKFQSRRLFFLRDWKRGSIMAAELLNQEERKMDFTFYMPARVISGPGAVLENGGQIKKLGDRALLVTGAHSCLLYTSRCV